MFLLGQALGALNHAPGSPVVSSGRLAPPLVRLGASECVLGAELHVSSPF